MNKENFKIHKIYFQDQQVFSAIIIGPNKRDYGNGVDKEKDEVYYLGYFYSLLPAKFSVFPEKYKIINLVLLGNHVFQVSIEDESQNIFNGIMCALKTETLVDFMMLIITNKQIPSAKEKEILKFFEPLKKAYESNGKPHLNFSLSNYLK